MCNEDRYDAEVNRKYGKESRKVKIFIPYITISFLVFAVMLLDNLPNLLFFLCIVSGTLLADWLYYLSKNGVEMNEKKTGKS